MATPTGVAVLLAGEAERQEHGNVRTLHQRMAEKAVLDHPQHIYLAIQTLVRVSLKNY